MEYVVFGLAVFVLAIYWIWRVRRGGTSSKERFVEGLPDDQRDKTYPGP